MATRAGTTETELREIFPAFEDCYRAAYELGLARLSHTVATAAGCQGRWLERVRSGLVALLGFCDDHPAWARVLVLEAPVSADVAFQCKQQLHGVLNGVLDCQRPASVPAGSSLLTAALTSELIVGGVLSVIHTSMLKNSDGKLVELAPSLMAFIVMPYLGKAAAQAELEGTPAGQDEASTREVGLVRARALSLAGELPVRATHRTTLVLRAIAQAPYSNNREIGQAAGIADEGQASKLLARLERRGVIENVGVGATRGEPNAWLLTASGERALELIGASGAARPRRARVRGAG